MGEYGAAAKAKLANPASTGQPEDQLRNPLETLFTGLAAEASVKQVTLVGETSLADLKTRPDFSVTAGKALIGFIEVKAPARVPTRTPSPIRTTRRSGTSSSRCPI